MNDSDLRDLLAQLPPEGREVLRRAARADQWERDELSQALLRAPGGSDAANLVDLLTLDDDARRQVVRVLGEMEASRRD